MLGGLLVKFAFVACLAALFAFLENHRSGNEKALRAARIFFLSSVGTIVLFSAYQLYNILTHQFQYTYIWSYSSRSLSTPLLISTFYAGQEGSFMLWTLFTALIGVFLMRDTARKGYEPQVMTIYSTIQAALLLMLIFKNPFLYVWETWEGQVQAGFVPVDGRGLNPLLQNYWMVIHPQVLFSGFAAMGVPYSYAVAALMKRDYANWIRPATPWIVYGATVLGCGIMMGGFWAYETLGWGGYWGWDPVENSSLVPWLFSVGTIHTILTQRKSGAFVRTNLVLAMLCFITVLYSTFLTRSGILGETSVHSFVDPGMMVYWLLIGVLALFIGIGLAFLILRRNEMPKIPPTHTFLSREFALFLGSAALVFAALFITVGTSSPIITQILQGKTTAVDISYYVTTIFPIGIVIAILAGVGQLLWWTRTEKRGLTRVFAVPVAIAVAGTIALAFAARITDVRVALFVFGSIFALAANLVVGWRIVKGNPKYAGGSIAHVGLAIMFIGFVGSAKYDEKQTLSLTQDMPVDALGYRLTYTGYRPIDEEKYAFEVQVEREGKRYTVAPIMYYSKYNEGLMRNPDIVNLITKDLYVAPLSLEQEDATAKSSAQRFRLKKGETTKIGDLNVTFVDFDFPVIEKAAMLEGKDVQIGATLLVSNYGKRPKEIAPRRKISRGEVSEVPAIFEKRHEFTIASMQPDRENKGRSEVEIAYTDLVVAAQTPNAPNPDVLVVEASLKPYINLVWSGVIVILVGFLVTMVRRSQEARLKMTSEAFDSLKVDSLTPLTKRESHESFAGESRHLATPTPNS
ncbi:MAG: cytochrome c biogenesis protein CcsA [Ignavibacteriae bacterium]|nr:cytochrome c biogenesis protein CcsA [Ignavibacteriota bacterium]